jgi:PAS domain S-box-containing protein
MDKSKSLKKLEELTQQLNEKDKEIYVLNKIYENAIEGVSYLNKNGIYEKVNSSYAKILGYTPEELINKHWHMTVAKEFIPIAEDAYYKMLSSLKETVEIKGIRKDNSNLWKRVTFIPDFKNEELIGHYCFMQDISAQKQTEIELKESASKFSQAFEHAAIGMSIVALDGKFLKVNNAFMQMLGYSEEEFLSTDFQSITFPDDLSVDLNYVAQLLNNNIPTYEMTKRYLTKDKKVFWAHLTVSLIKDKNNNPKYFVSQVLNINRLVELELLLKIKN